MSEQRTWIAVCVVVVLSVLTSNASAQPSGPTEDEKAEASMHFRRGAELFQEGIFRGALVELRRAYEIAPNYRVLYNIGQTHVALGEFVEAIGAFEMFLDQGGDRVDPARREELQKEIDQLRGRTAMLSIRVNRPGAMVSVDGTAMGRAPLKGDVPVNVGSHQITAKAEDGSTATQELSVAGGDSRVVMLTLVAPVAKASDDADAVAVADPGMPPRKRWSIGLMAAAGALALGGGASAIAASSAKDAHSKAVDDIPGDPTEIRDTRDQLSRRALAADVLFAAAIATGATGLVLFFVKDGDEAQPEESGEARLRLKLLPNALVAEGRF